jgi:predicted ester cyclase
MVAVRHRYRGTHTGDYIGFAPSGIAVEVPAHDIYRMTDDGKIAEEWVVMDQLSMLQQIGIIPKREA